MVKQRQVAKWIKPNHRVGIKMISELYKSSGEQKLANLGQWKFQNNTGRVATFRKGDEIIVVFKGTQLGGNSSRKDISDDLAVSIGVPQLVSLLNEGDLIVQNLIDQGIPISKISTTGHSLGGYAATKISEKYKLKSFVFNSAAPPTAPIPIGPGKEYQTNYHIVGDLISSHVSDESALVIRANKNTNFGDSLFNHEVDRFYEDDPTYSFWDSKKENSLFSRDILAVVEIASAIIFLPLIALEASTIGAAAIAEGVLFGGEAVVETLGTIYNIIKEGEALELAVEKTAQATVLARTILQPIPGHEHEGSPEKLYYSDTEKVNHKEINAAWKGQPLTNYTPDKSDPVEIPKAVPIIATPAQPDNFAISKPASGREVYNEEVRKSVEHQKEIKKRAMEYKKDRSAALKNLNGKRDNDDDLPNRELKTVKSLYRQNMLEKPSSSRKV